MQRRKCVLSVALPPLLQWFSLVPEGERRGDGGPTRRPFVSVNIFVHDGKEWDCFFVAASFNTKQKRKQCQRKMNWTISCNDVDEIKTVKRMKLCLWGALQ
ncbi:uncharacterized protein TM35_000541000 [Trypanosoma theileri]|uniref:Secreted protein n=1 Tax=Trypanosoma theileri TaxID=67003 RepID=A0A1X0NGP7_9TRYP|nr:uncharacterized protein TM35_000541000 [Trypanosoma theileri]ORC83876.1 hypothetical protein TM35_000541000 [Trypanosoma theileri]